jgi:putative sigma-54 modulation protein
VDNFIDLKRTISGNIRIHTSYLIKRGVAFMNYIIKGKQVTVTPAMQEKAEKKISKFEKFFRPDAEAVLTFKVEKDRNIFEVAIYSGGTIIRAEERGSDMYTAMDLVVEKLERQIRKYKTKLGKKIHQEAMVQENFNINEKIDEDNDFEVVRTKRFPLKPMDVEEAILQMDLLGHSFFVFINAETETVNVVYKRIDGRYGLIEPEL